MLSSSPAYIKESEHRVHTTACPTSYRQSVAESRPKPTCYSSLPHLVAFKEPVCLLFSHMQPWWKVALIIHSSTCCPLVTQPLSPRSCFFQDFTTLSICSCKVITLKGYKHKQQPQPRCTAWSEFKNCWKASWICFLFSPYFMKRIHKYHSI